MTLNTPYMGIIYTHSLVLSTVNLNTKFEVSCFTRSKDMTGPRILEMGHATVTTPKANTCYDLPVHRI